MSIVVLTEQRPPFILMLASRGPTYAYIIISLLAVLLFQAFPSWAITKPPVRKVNRKRRSASLTSNATTLVDPDEVDVSSAENKKQHHVSFSDKLPFKRLGSSVKLAFSSSKSMNYKPKFSRRLSLPARRLSSSVITAFHHLTPHLHHSGDKVDSYFFEKKVDLEVNNLADDQVVESQSSRNESPEPPIVESFTQPQMQVEKAPVGPGQTVECASASQVTPPKKGTSFKRVVRRVSIILHFAPRT